MRLPSSPSGSRPRSSVTPPGPLLDRGVEEELEVRVGQDDRPDVAPGHHDPACRCERLVAARAGRRGARGPQRRPRPRRRPPGRGRRRCGRRRRRGPGAGGPFASGASSTSSHEPARPVRIRRPEAPREREPGHGPVQQPRVAEPVADLERGRGADAALAGRARPIEGDDEPGRLGDVEGPSLRIAEACRPLGLPPGYRCAGPGWPERRTRQSAVPSRRRGSCRRCATGPSPVATPARDVPPPAPRPRTSGARSRRARAAPQVVEADRTDPDADQPLDRRADGTEHPAQLALPALGQDRAVPGQVCRAAVERARRAGGSRSRSSARRPVSVARPSSSGMPGLEGLDLVGGQRRPQPDRVLALDAVARMEDAIGPRAVVGEDEEALGILVEPADRVEPGALGDAARSGSGRGRSSTAWRSRTVDVTPAGLWSSRYSGADGGADDAAVDGDDRPGRGSTCMPSVGDLAVDRDAAGGDEDLARPARRDARGGEDLLEAFGGISARAVSRRLGRSASRRSDRAARVAAAGRSEQRLGDGFAALLARAARRRRRRAAAARRGSSARTARGIRSRCRTGTAGRAPRTGRARR